MVKRIYVILDDKEYKKLVKEKGRKTWKDFILDLLEFKHRVEEEGNVINKSSLKDPYLELAKVLKKLGFLMKISYGKEYKYQENWEYEAAALLPLFVAGEELNEDEKRKLAVIAVNTLWSILDKLYPKYAEELKWLAQALRMLAIGNEDLYELSMENFIEAWSRRKGSSSN